LAFPLFVSLLFRHRAGVTPYTSAFALAGSCVFGKQSLEPLLCDPLTLGSQGATRYAGYPFSRSYGVNLPSSLTRDHSSTLAYLCPATGVGLRYGRSRHPDACFSGRQVSTELPHTELSHASARLPKETHLHAWTQHLQRCARPNSPRTRGRLDRPRAVTEYQPFVHRLRLSASA